MQFFLVVFARQAWIQADANRYNGANEELLWKAFASRGLGFGAADYNDSFWLPSHDKPVIIYSEQTKLPPLKGTDICGVAPGSIVSIRLNPSTIATLFGVWFIIIQISIFLTLNLDFSL